MLSEEAGSSVLRFGSQMKWSSTESLGRRHEHHIKTCKSNQAVSLRVLSELLFSWIEGKR